MHMVYSGYYWGATIASLVLLALLVYALILNWNIQKAESSSAFFGFHCFVTSCISSSEACFNSCTEECSLTV